MNTTPSSSGVRRAAAWTLALGLLGGAPAWAAGKAAPAGDSAYQRERAACLSGQTGQEREACLREAAAARDEAKRNKLGNNVSPEQKEANKLERCKMVRAEDRAACERLARGEGVERGSVAGGGVIKETVTRTTGSASAPQR